MYLTFVIRNGVGENYYVVANSPDEASAKLEAHFGEVDEVQVLSRSLVDLGNGIYSHSAIV